MDDSFEVEPVIESDVVERVLPDTPKKECQHCPFTTSRKFNLDRHVKIHHPIPTANPPETKGVLCDECGVKLSTLFNLRRHKRHMHETTGTSKNVCPVCGEHFNLPGHSIADMVVVGIERVLPRGDKLIRTIREAYWINQYESCTFGANRQE